MISQSDLFKLFRMISRCVINCDECALRFYVCSIFVDRVFVLFIFHHGVHWTYKCFAYVAPRGWIWVRRGLCGFGDIRGSVGRYDPWGIKATGFAITTKINHYAAVTLRLYGVSLVVLAMGDEDVGGRQLIHLCGVGNLAGDGDLGGVVLAGGGVGDDV